MFLLWFCLSLICFDKDNSIKGSKKCYYFFDIYFSSQRAAINNWACLTIGLLKREYSKKENERQEKQLAYLLERESFLDHHLDGFIQDPDMRTTKDTALIINSEMLRSFMVNRDL